jgi:excisionase family DNA binding protein
VSPDLPAGTYLARDLTYQGGDLGGTRFTLPGLLRAGGPRGPGGQMTTPPGDSYPLERATEKPPRLTYSVEEVAAVLGLSRSKTYQLVARGAIPIVPLAGRRKLIARVTVDRLLAGEPLETAG